MRHLLIFGMLLFSVCFAQAQITIHFDFPHFFGQVYMLSIYNGEKQDTIYRGALDVQGKSTVVLPTGYKDFTGMAHWALLNGGGLELVLNKEKNITIRCQEAQPSPETIEFDTPENKFLYSQNMQLSTVINKTIACRSVLEQYEVSDSIYRIVDAEKKRLEEQFEQTQKEIRQSLLYSARIREMNDYLTYTGSRMTLTETEMMVERRDFILHRLDLQQLYHSGLWGHLLDAFVSSMSGNDSLLVADSRTLLARAAEKEEMAAVLLNKFISLYNRYGKENLLVKLGVNDLLSPGHVAPLLNLNGKPVLPTNSLIIFYESGCGNCENELLLLRNHYSMLKEKGIRVISIAADQDENIYRTNAELFPWPDRYCDYQGFEGENFRNYEIKGSPTIFVIDKEGKIVERSARLADAMEKNE